MQNTPAEPEMWFFLFPKKPAFSNSRTKRFLVFTTKTASESKTLSKYRQHERKHYNLSLIQCLHLFSTNSANPKPYKHRSTLVGTKTLSIFNNEHFFQYVLLNLPHRNIQTLQHPNHEHLLQYLQWYAAAPHHFPDVWTNDENLRSILIKPGPRNYYVETVLGHIASMHDLFYLLQIQVIIAQQLDTAQIPGSNELTLDHFQLAVVRHIDTAVSLRQQYYHNQHRFRQ